MSSIDALVTAVASEDTPEAAANVAIQGLISQVAQLRSTSTDPATTARIDVLVTRANAVSAALAKAIGEAIPKDVKPANEVAQPPVEAPVVEVAPPPTEPPPPYTPEPYAPTSYTPPPVTTPVTPTPGVIR